MESYYHQFLEDQIDGRGEAELRMDLRSEGMTDIYSHFAIRVYILCKDKCR
jgi:hypothetical protein